MSSLAEIEELFSELAESDKKRLVLRFVLNLPPATVARLMGESRGMFYYSLKKVCSEVLHRMQENDEIIAAIQAAFCDFHDYD